MKKYLDPSKLKLELVKEEYSVIPSGTDRIRKTWRIGEYNVVEYRNHDDPYEVCFWIDKNIDAPFGVPEIYDEYNSFGSTTTGFTIKTTDHGALPPDKIEKVVAGYTYALAVVKILETLIKPPADSHPAPTASVENPASQE